MSDISLCHCIVPIDLFALFLFSYGNHSTHKFRIHKNIARERCQLFKSRKCKSMFFGELRKPIRGANGYSKLNSHVKNLTWKRNFKSIFDVGMSFSLSKKIPAWNSLLMMHLCLTHPPLWMKRLVWYLFWVNSWWRLFEYVWMWLEMRNFCVWFKWKFKKVKKFKR